jgi:hypothetical protein
MPRAMGMREFLEIAVFGAIRANVGVLFKVN